MGRFFNEDNFFDEAYKIEPYLSIMKLWSASS